MLYARCAIAPAIAAAVPAAFWVSGDLLRKFRPHPEQKAAP